MENLQIITQSSHFLQPNNSLDPQSFLTLRGLNNRYNQSEISHLNSLNFDFVRPQQLSLRSNFNFLTNNIRPQTIPIFASNQHSIINFLNPLHSFNQNVNNLSVESRNFWPN
jgi:hypothetical protein